MYIFNTLGSCYCLLKQWSAYIINSSACIINVWGYTEIFPVSSSEFDARSSDLYSCTTSQPSLFLSANLTSFCLFLIFSFPLFARLFTSSGLSALLAISVTIASTDALNSNCFLFPLDLNSQASFSILDCVLSCLPFSASCEVKKVFKRPKTC